MVIGYLFWSRDGFIWRQRRYLRNHATSVSPVSTAPPKCKV